MADYAEDFGHREIRLSESPEKKLQDNTLSLLVEKEAGKLTAASIKSLVPVTDFCTGKKGRSSAAEAPRKFIQMQKSFFAV